MKQIQSRSDRGQQLRLTVSRESPQADLAAALKLSAMWLLAAGKKNSKTRKPHTGRKRFSIRVIPSHLPPKGTSACRVRLFSLATATEIKTC